MPIRQFLVMMIERVVRVRIWIVAVRVSMKIVGAMIIRIAGVVIVGRVVVVVCRVRGGHGGTNEGNCQDEDYLKTEK